MQEYKQAGVVEYVTFKAVKGVNDEALQSAAFNTDAVLNSIDGFIKRDIAKSDDDIWVEVVYWRDSISAEKGLESFLKDPLSKAFLDLIEEDSVDIRYASLLSNPN